MGDQRVYVVDEEGQPLSPTTAKRARQLLATGKASLVQEDPFTIRVHRRVTIPRSQAEEKCPGEGKRILLHICCAPCSVYPIRRLRELGFEVVGFWYNPNIHPYSEHERRREALVEWAEHERLPVIWSEEYEMPAFLRKVAAHPRFGVRCRLCYAMRLQRTAEVAAREGFDAFTTTLLGSPYQDQAAIRSIGERMARRYGVPFYFENFRRGWAERGRVVREVGLYSQRYCGCVYSEWEALDPGASTKGRS